MNLTQRLFLSAAGILTLSFALHLAPRADSSTARAASPPAVLRVGHFPNLTHAPLLIARERADFEKAFPGTKIDWKVFPAGPLAVEALYAGELDLAYMGPTLVVNGYVRSKGESFQLVSGLTQGGAAFVARNGSTFTDPRNMRGQRIATPQLGNTQDLSLRHWIVSNGQKTKDKGGDVNILPMVAADQLQLFLKGELDGAWAVEPWASRMVSEAGCRVLMEESSIWPDGQYATTVLVATRDILQKRPDVVRRWLDTQEGLLDWINATPDSARTLANAGLLKLTGKALSGPVMDGAWKRLHFTSSPAMGSIETMTAWAAELGFLGRGRPDIRGLADLTLLEQARAARSSASPK